MSKIPKTPYPARLAWAKRLAGALSVALLCGGASAQDGRFGTFARSLSHTSHGYQRVPDPTGSAPSAQVDRFEVRAGDCGANSGWNDCATDRERSELSDSGSSATTEGSEWWYGWSLYLPTDYPLLHPAKTALGQFHQHNGPPAFMFQNGGGGYWIDRNFGKTTDYVQLLTQAQMQGAWNRVEVHARWSQQDGFFQVYINGDLKYDFKGPTMTQPSVYFKYGVYRSYVSRYGSPAPTQVVLFAQVQRAQTRQGLSTPANAALPPVRAN